MSMGADKDAGASKVASRLLAKFLVGVASGMTPEAMHAAFLMMRIADSTAGAMDDAEAGRMAQTAGRRVGSMLGVSTIRVISTALSSVDSISRIRKAYHGR